MCQIQPQRRNVPNCLNTNNKPNSWLQRYSQTER